jgi:hypothetical protein
MGQFADAPGNALFSPGFFLSAADADDPTVVLDCASAALCGETDFDAPDDGLASMEACDSWRNCFCKASNSC